MSRQVRTHAFGLVLSGGGARGFAHAGALKALEENGLSPSFIIGVSMGGLVGVTYASRKDWFEALMKLDFAAELAGEHLNPYLSNSASKFRFFLHLPRTIWSFFFGWGLTSLKQAQALRVLERLTLGQNLEDGRIGAATSTTDLISGRRVILDSGSAARAIYASAALAGVFSPLREQEYLLVDGAYSDLAPIDVARDRHLRTVIAIDASQSLRMPFVRNGVQALMRAVEICHNQHAELRFEQSDLVLRPSFKRPIHTLEFTARDECIEAGYNITSENISRIRSILNEARNKKKQSSFRRRNEATGRSK